MQAAEQNAFVLVCGAAFGPGDLRVVDFAPVGRPITIVDLAPSGPDSMFPSDKVDRLVILLDGIRTNAMAV